MEGVADRLKTSPCVTSSAVVELWWGLRGPGPPERPGGPRKTYVFERVQSAYKDRPPQNICF